MMKSKRTSIWISLLLVFISLVLFPGVSASWAGGKGDCKRCREQLLKRYETAKRPCTPAVDLMVSLGKEIAEFQREYNARITLMRETIPGDVVEYAKRLKELQETHENLIAAAAWDGAVLPKGIAARVYGKAKPGELMMFGIPQAAMTFDAELAKKAGYYHSIQNEILLVWEDEAKKFEEKAKGYIEKINREAKAQLKTIQGHYKNINLMQRRLWDMFYSGKYEHCLGRPLPVQTYQVVSRGGGPAKAGAKDVGKFKKPGVSRLEDLPGMRYRLPPWKTVKALYEPIPVPGAPSPPKEVQFYRDGRKYAQIYAEVQQKQMAADTRIARVRALIAITRIGQLPLKKGTEFAVNMVEGTALFAWGVGKGLVKPLGNLLDTNKTLCERAKKMGTDYLHVPGKALESLSMGWVHAWAQLFGVTHKLHEDIRSRRMTPNAKFSDDVLTGLETHVLKPVSSALSDLRAVKTLAEGGPRYPGGGAFRKDLLQYIRVLKQRRKEVTSAAEKVEAVEKGVNNALESGFSKVEAALQIAGTVGMVKMAGKAMMSRKAFVQERLQKVRAIRKALAEWKKAQKRAGAGIESLEKKLEQFKLAREIEARQALGERVPKEAAEVAEKTPPLKEIIEKETEIAKARNTVAELEKKAVEQTLKEQAESAKRTGEFKKEGELGLGKGKKLTYGKSLGEGTFKTTYEHPDAGKVVQVYHREHTPAEIASTLQRETVGMMRLKKAGVGFPKVYEVRRLPDGTVIKVAKRVNPKNILKEVMKKHGGLNVEQQAAIRMALYKLNKKGYILSDPNTGNWYFTRNKAGMLEARILDPDGVVSVKDLINEKGVLEGGKKHFRIEIGKGNQKEVFDLNTYKGVAGLQKRIAIGLKLIFDAANEREAIFLKSFYGDFFSKKLGTKAYGKPDGYVPASGAQLNKAFGKSFEEAEKFFEKSPDELVKILSEARKKALGERLSKNEAYSKAKSLLKEAEKETSKSERQIRLLEAAKEKTKEKAEAEVKGAKEVKKETGRKVVEARDEARKKAAELDKKAGRRIVERQKQAAARKEKFEQKGTLKLSGGKEVAYGKQLGKGSLQTVYEGKNPNEVVKVYHESYGKKWVEEQLKKQIEMKRKKGKVSKKTIEKIKKILEERAKKKNKDFVRDAIQRRVETDMRLKRAGIPFTKTRKIARTSDGRIVVIEERINTENTVSNLFRKQGNKLTTEQQAAIVELRDKLAKNGLVGTDLSFANLDFIRDKSGRLHARVIDKDAVVNVKNLVAEGKGSIEINVKGKVNGTQRTETEKFDLNKPEDVKRLQDLLFFGKKGWQLDATDLAKQVMTKLRPRTWQNLPAWGGPGSYTKWGLVSRDIISKSGKDINKMLEEGRKEALKKELSEKERAELEQAKKKYKAFLKSRRGGKTEAAEKTAGAKKKKVEKVVDMAEWMHRHQTKMNLANKAARYGQQQQGGKTKGGFLN